MHAAMAKYAVASIEDVQGCLDGAQLCVFRDRAVVDDNRVYIPMT